MKKLFALVTFVVAMSANAACDLGPTIPGTGGPMNCYEPRYPIAVHNTSSSSSANANASATANSSANANSTQANVQTSNVTVTGDTVTYQAQERNPVASAYAAPLTTSNGTCMGSKSAGLQGVGFGLSVAGTWVDEGCDARYDAMALAQAGLREAAVARLCMKPEIAQAMKASGTPCK